jgi:hypothetical protein
MYDFALNDDCDLSIKNGKIVPALDADEVIQRIRTHLWRYYGEWFLDTTLGMPWYGGVKLLGNKNFTLAGLYVRKEILNVYGVSQIVSVAVSPDVTGRTTTIGAQVLTIYGATELKTIVME